MAGCNDDRCHGDVPIKCVAIFKLGLRAAGAGYFFEERVSVPSSTIKKVLPMERCVKNTAKADRHASIISSIVALLLSRLSGIIRGVLNLEDLAKLVI